MKIKKVVTILPDSSASMNYFEGNVLRLISINSASDIDGEVLMTSHSFEDVFGTEKKTADNFLKQLPIVKICANGKKIHRAYRGVSVKGFNKELVALSPNSIMLLNDNNGVEPEKVELSEGSILPFYWYHPDKAIRLSFKIGLISLLMGIISIAISIIGLM